MLCPICYDDVPIPVILSCGHGSCQSCLQKWFAVEETTGQTSPTCAVETCRTPVSITETLIVLGRHFAPAGTKNKKRRFSSLGTARYHDGESSAQHPPQERGEPAPNATTDEATETWLRDNTIQCGGCEGRIMKDSGCDKLQCICGYQVCWKCHTAKAACRCNPGHLFIDNVTGHSQWGESKVASKEELRDLKSYLENKRESGQARFVNSFVEAHPLNLPFFMPFAPQEPNPEWSRPAQPTVDTTLASLFSFTAPPLPPQAPSYPHGMPPPNHHPYGVSPFHMPPPASLPTSSRQRQAKIIQCIIQDDLDMAADMYLNEVEKHGGTPPWAGELKFYLRTVFLKRQMDLSDVGSLFPGISL